MKAVLLYGYGGVDQLRYEDAPDPQPGNGEVVIQVISTSINPVDYKIRQGAMKQLMPLDLPAILGRDVAGRVTLLGSGVSKFQAGDMVMGLVNRSYAEYLATSADDLCGIPDGLDPETAGALPLVLLTGAQLIEKGVQPKSGEVILITGAAGSVGRTAVYVAKQHGASVIAGVKSAQKGLAESIGADSVALLDDEREVAALPELDAIADTVGGEIIEKLIPRLKKSGRLASVLGKPAAAEKLGIEVREVWCRPDAERLRVLAEDARDRKLNIPVAKRMRLSEIREAQSTAEAGVDGKIVLLP